MSQIAVIELKCPIEQTICKFHTLTSLLHFPILRTTNYTLNVVYKIYCGKKIQAVKSSNPTLELFLLQYCMQMYICYNDDIIKFEHRFYIQTNEIKIYYGKKMCARVFSKFSLFKLIIIHN